MPKRLKAKTSRCERALASVAISYITAVDLI